MILVNVAVTMYLITQSSNYLESLCLYMLSIYIFIHIDTYSCTTMSFSVIVHGYLECSYSIKTVLIRLAIS